MAESITLASNCPKTSRRMGSRKRRQKAMVSADRAPMA